MTANWRLLERRLLKKLKEDRLTVKYLKTNFSNYQQFTQRMEKPLPHQKVFFGIVNGGWSRVT